MAVRSVHLVFGQSNAAGRANKGDLTDTRYDIVDADVQSVYRVDADPVVGPETMTIHDTDFSVEIAIGHRRKAAGEALPLVIRYAVGGTSLASSWRPNVSSGQYVIAMSTLWERLDHCRRVAFPSDTFEFRSLTMVQGEADTLSDADAAAYEANVRQFVTVVRRDVSPNLPIFWVRLSADFNQVGSTPERLALVRAAPVAVAADVDRFYWVDADGVELFDSVHYSADGLIALGDRVADLQEEDGLGGVGQYAREARVFSTLVDAQTFGTAAATALGARNEDPALGGFGVRGAGARDPWPTTPRSAVKKHPYRNEWAVLVDAAMDAEGALDCDTNRRPVDDPWWAFV